jgi:hypothetical protein
MAWALALAGIAVACGSASDLDFAESDAGASAGGVTAVTQHYGGVLTAPPMAGRAGGSIVLATGGTVSTYCGPGYACSPPGSMCGNAGLTCQCVGGAWLCSGVIVGTGATGSGATGAGATGAVAVGVGGATSPPIPIFQIQAQGYVVAGIWHGYAWTAAVTSAAPGAAMSSINPPDFSGVAAGATQLCAQGTIGAASDYGGVAMIGVNVNQALFADAGIPPTQTVAIGGSGITVRYSNPGGTQIRVQIQTPTGDTSATGRWCATLSGPGGTETLPWSSFWGGVADGTQGCWNAGGTHPPVGTQISNVALLVPGSNSMPVPYSFCLQSVAQA